MIKIKESECVVRDDGTKQWWLNGQIHRFYKPAVIHPDGTQEWILRGKHHRENAPSIIYANGNKTWHMHGSLHREDGPAIIRLNGAVKEWYIKGIRHRDDGPACMWPEGVRWYLHNIGYSFENWADRVSLPRDELIEMKLLYG